MQPEWYGVHLPRISGLSQDHLAKVGLSILYSKRDVGGV